MKNNDEITVRAKSCGGYRSEKMPMVEMKDAFVQITTERKTDNENKKHD